MGHVGLPHFSYNGLSGLFDYLLFTKPTGAGTHDFINANFIGAPGRDNAYIACQG